MSFYTWILIAVVWTLLGAFVMQLCITEPNPKISRKAYMLWVTVLWPILFGFCLIAFFIDYWKYEDLSIRLNPWKFMDGFASWLKKN